MKSTAEAAVELGCSERTVRRWCQTHEIGQKIGSVFVLSALDVERLRALVKTGPGNPDWIKAKKKNGA